ncbi:MAG: hypothetical protein JWQ95_3021 [Sphaerisporangium sp.]|nr:hypothetical protein [Sphaerisporangium sp.]
MGGTASSSGWDADHRDGDHPHRDRDADPRSRDPDGDPPIREDRNERPAGAASCRRGDPHGEARGDRRHHGAARGDRLHEGRRHGWEEPHRHGPDAAGAGPCRSRWTRRGCCPGAGRAGPASGLRAAERRNRERRSAAPPEHRRVRLHQGRRTPRDAGPDRAGDPASDRNRAAHPVRPARAGEERSRNDRNDRNEEPRTGAPRSAGRRDAASPGGEPRYGCPRYGLPRDAPPRPGVEPRQSPAEAAG